MTSIQQNDRLVPEAPMEEWTEKERAAALPSSGSKLKPLSHYYTPSDDDKNSANGQQGDTEETSPQYGFLERQARRVARSPQTHLWVALLSAIFVSALGMYFGDFSVSFENFGWPSRGTLVSNRHSQFMLVNRNRKALAKQDNNHDAWMELTTNVQCGWEVPDGACEEKEKTEKDSNAVKEESDEEVDRQGPPSPTNLTALWNQCDYGMYTQIDFLGKGRLWPVWQVTDSDASALDPPLLQDICEAEEQTQKVLHRKGLCHGCANDQCLPPLSIVLFARVMVPNGMAMTCSELAQAWAPLQAETEQELRQCIGHLRGFTDLQDLVEDRGPCPMFFSPVMVDNWFDQTGRVSYTSSVFVTRSKDSKKMYKYSDRFGRGTSGRIQGVYDSQYMKFVEYYALDSIPHDMALMTSSALITTAAMMFHTRSPFLTFIGIVQISLSFPLAYTIYRFAGGITFFPFLNLVGVFVAFALGADHVFVAVDKWKNYRIEHPKVTTEDVAGKALPGAGRAMVLTTITTAIAFFGSGICPVLPVKLFGIFCGLLIAVDYILDCLVMFPCLCIYDSYRFQRNYCMDIRCAKDTDDEDEPTLESRRAISYNIRGEEEKVDEDDLSDFSKDKQAASTQEETTSSSSSVAEPQNNSLIRRVLSSYYDFLHRWNWAILGLSLVAIGVCSYFATTLRPPTTSTDIQILVDSVEHEKARSWRPELLFNALLTNGGGRGFVIWGVTPADTGDHLNPYSWSELVLDDTFDPSSKAAQVYMRDYCDRFFAQEFASPVTDGHLCTINRFDNWLREQSNITAEDPKASAAYATKCQGSTEIPLEEDVFHPCLAGYAEETKNNDILVWDGVVKVIFFSYRARVRFDSPNSVIGKEWQLVQGWMDDDQESAPAGVANGFFSAGDYLIWDTNNAVYQTALGSGGIAIIVSALVILISSRSLTLTVFSAISVAYVLVSVASVMSAAQWTLGFLESICFTILIGLSADFVLHFSHAYCELPGDIERGVRTKHALIHLGPSILAAGFTTLVGAAVMLFTVIYFWRLFALVLFFTIVQATIGSFVVFLVLTDCLGPSTPTFLADKITSKCVGFCQRLQTETQTLATPKPPELPQASTAEIWDPYELELDSQPSIEV